MDILLDTYQDLGLLDGINLEGLRGLLIGAFVFAVVGLLAFLVLYTLRTYGLYVLAKRLDIPKPTRAFYPVVEYYIMGAICDKALGDGRRSRVVITVFKAIEVGLISVAFVLMLCTCIYVPDIADMVFDIMDGNVTSLSLDTFVNDSTIGVALLLAGAGALYGLSSIFTFGFNIAYAIVSYRVYLAYGCKVPALMTILTFMIQPVGHVYLFVIRNRDPRAVK